MRTRLAEYRAKTAPILPIYEARGLVGRVDGMAPIGAVGAAIDAILDALRNSPRARCHRAKSCYVPVSRLRPVGPEQTVWRRCDEQWGGDSLIIEPVLETRDRASEHVDLPGFMEGVKRRNPGQSEFIQAVQEVAEDIFDFIDDKEDYHRWQILRRIAEPDRVVSLPRLLGGRQPAISASSAAIASRTTMRSAPIRAASASTRASTNRS